MSPFADVHMSALLAPSTFPTILYLLLKNLYQSFNTVFFSSGKSYHSGTHSSAFNEEDANALDGSLPAKTVLLSVKVLLGAAPPGSKRKD